MYEKENKRARILLIGSGRMGQIRAMHLIANPRFELCGVVDVNLEGAKSLAGTYHVPYFASLTEAIAHYKQDQLDPEISVVNTDEVASIASTDISVLSDSNKTANSLDAVLISTPTFTHSALIEESARNKLSIFTEKPVDETAEKILELFDTCKAAQVTLACGFQRRFDPSYVRVKELIERNEIGKPLMGNIFFGDHPCPPIEFLLKGGNLWSDLLCHDADFIRWCLNDEVASVYATGTSSSQVLKDNGIFDNGSVLLKFKKGAVVTVSMSRSATYGYDQRCEVFGESGMTSIKNHDSNSAVLSNASGIHNSTYKPGFKSRFSEAFAAELDAFADTVLNETPWPITAEDCVAAQAMADAANISCEENRIVLL